MSPAPESESSSAASSGAKLVRSLGLFDCTMIVMGCIIGAGVFNTPRSIAQHMGSLEGILALWAIGGAIAMSGALVFAELGALLPHAGGQYVFLREGFGRFVAFMFGWLLLAAINSGAIAYVANVFVDHFQALVRYGGWDVEWSGDQRRAIALVVIVGLALLNIRGVRFGANVQNAAMLAKIAGIALIVLLGALAAIGLAHPRPAALNPVASGLASEWTWGGVGASLLAVMFTYGGWQNVTAVAGEVRNPERTLPRGILIGTVAVIALYVSMNASLVAILGVEGVASSSTPAAAAAGAVFAWGEPLVAGLVMLSTFAITQALLMVTPRIYYAMACDGLFFSQAAYVHPRYKTPAVAIALQGAAGITHLFLGETLSLLQMTEIVDATFFALCAVALFVLRVKRPDLPRPYKAWGYPWIPGLFLLATLAVVVTGVAGAERVATQHVAWLVGAGIALYFVWNRGRSKGSGGSQRAR